MEIIYIVSRSNDTLKILKWNKSSNYDLIGPFTTFCSTIFFSKHVEMTVFMDQEFMIEVFITISRAITAYVIGKLDIYFPRDML